MTFAVITVALVAGSVADRLRFSAFLWFCVLWLYVPIAHWVWGGGFLARGHDRFCRRAGRASQRRRRCLVAALLIGKRRGYGHENLAPFDLPLAVIGTWLLWVGWCGFNGGSALGANARAARALARGWRLNGRCAASRPCSA
jgi:Amt family ammonium transporter